METTSIAPKPENPDTPASQPISKKNFANVVFPLKGMKLHLRSSLPQQAEELVELYRCLGKYAPPAAREEIAKALMGRCKLIKKLGKDFPSGLLLRNDAISHEAGLNNRTPLTLGMIGVSKIAFNPPADLDGVNETLYRKLGEVRESINECADFESRKEIAPLELHFPETLLPRVKVLIMLLTHQNLVKEERLLEEAVHCAGSIIIFNCVRGMFEGAEGLASLHSGRGGVSKMCLRDLSRSPNYLLAFDSECKRVQKELIAEFKGRGVGFELDAKGSLLGTDLALISSEKILARWSLLNSLTKLGRIEPIIYREFMQLSGELTHRLPRYVGLLVEDHPELIRYVCEEARRFFRSRAPIYSFERWRMTLMYAIQDSPTVGQAKRDLLGISRDLRSRPGQNTHPAGAALVQIISDALEEWEAAVEAEVLRLADDS